VTVPTDDLPADWELSTVGEVATDIQTGFASGEHSSDGSGLPHFRPMNVSSQGLIDRAILKSVDPSLADRPERRLERGDVLFNNTNSIKLVGKTAYFDDADSPAFSNHMTRLRTDASKVEPEFLARYLHACWARGLFEQLANNHVSQASVGRKVLASVPLPLPPIPKQRQIIIFLKQVDDRRHRAIGQVERAQQLVSRFRQAVLTAACSGVLTETWRAEHPNAVSVESALLALSESPPRRREGGSGALVDLTLPELPSTYLVATVGEAAETIEYGTSKRCDADDDQVPVLRMGNIQNGELDLTDLKYCKLDSEIERLLLSDGDLLFNRTNSPELVGKSAVFHGRDEPMSFASYLIRVRFRPSVANPDFVNLWINSFWGREWARLTKTDGVSQSNINGAKLARMPLPLPPLEEQHETVRLARRLLDGSFLVTSQLDRVVRTVESASQAATALAFRGELTRSGVRE